MGKTHDAPVNNLVGFVSAFAPDVFLRLKDRFPDSPLLREGKVLGALSAPLATRLEIALAALEAMTKASDDAASGLLASIRSTGRWEFAGQVVALLGSGGTIATVLARTDALPQIATAATAFAGSAIALYVKFSRKDAAGSENGLLQVYRDLIRANGRAIELYGRLVPARRSQDDLGDAAALAGDIDQANDLAGNLYELLSLAGRPVTVHREQHPAE